MKKTLSVLLAASLSLGLVACGGNTDTPKNDSSATAGSEKVAETAVKDLRLPYVSDPESFDYVSTNKSLNSGIFTNFVQGLYENDRFGNLVPALAESYEVNEDATVFKYHLKKGIKWVTATGEEFAEVTAHDFVTAMQHAADFQSQMLELVENNIVGLSDYVHGKVGFDKVGVKALDDYTLEYTLTVPTPYFHTMTLYSILYPINKEFLESKGAGCALGAPKKEDCAFGTVTSDGILYNGPYILSAFDSKSKIEFVKNTNYWDKNAELLDTVTLLYDDGKDPYSVVKGYENGVYQGFSLVPSWKDYDDYKARYKDNVIMSLPNASAFNINFNFNRKGVVNSHKTPEQHAQTKKAIANLHFRKAVLHAVDRVSWLKQKMAEEVAISSLRNMNNFPSIVSTSDGESYGSLVSKAYRTLTGEDVSLTDGQDPFYNPEKAMAEIELAKKDGVQFPVTLDYVYIDGDSQIWVNSAKSLKEGIEKSTQGQIVIDLIGLPKQDAYKSTYLNETPEESDYDINSFSGWGPDYGDPKSFCDIYNVRDGAYLKSLGLHPLGEDADSDAILNDENIGFKHYQELLDKADAIKTDLDARYKAYAEADAYLVAQVLTIPSSMQTRGYSVTKGVPFQRPYGTYGVSGGSDRPGLLKNVKFQEKPLTKAQYDEAYAKWSQGK